MSLVLLADTPSQGWDISWTVIFSGIAALSGIFTVVYTTRSARKKADRELLAVKLELLFDEFKDEIKQATRAVEIAKEGMSQGIPLDTIFSQNVDGFRPIWSEANRAEILIALYFSELGPDFGVFRDHRTRIGIALRKLSSAPFPGAADYSLTYDLGKMVDAYSELREKMAIIAKTLAPRR
jgi:hypothetical protein